MPAVSVPVTVVVRIPTDACRLQATSLLLQVALSVATTTLLVAASAIQVVDSWQSVSIASMLSKLTPGRVIILAFVHPRASHAS